jgi:phospholipase C
MIKRTKLIILASIAVLALLLGADFGAFASTTQNTSTTATPIKHVVVIFQENVSFDHYFATYPNATNPPDEPQFTAKPGTPTVNGLTGSLLTDNPAYLYSCTLPSGCDPNDNPALLPRTEPVTCDNDHVYSAEQAAFNGGLMNQFPEQTSCSDGLVMDYYDGNTVTALWNYAQYFALNDNQFGTTFGPSTPGALNVVSGIGGPAEILVGPEGAPTATYTTNYPNPPDSASSGNNILANGQLINDIDPAYDDCSYTTDGSTATAAMMPGAENIGNLLNAKDITWGWFEGGFAPTNYTSTGQAICGASNANVGGTFETAYSPHHEPFQYFASTANPHHLPPSSASMIGYTDQANHQYDISSFWIAADSGNLPAVSYLKAPRYQDGHPTNSDPLDEQDWLVNTINKLMSLPTWSSTAIIIDWDDSDGWYDSVMPPVVNPSSDPNNDLLNGAGVCGQGSSPLGVEDRCGYGPRIPLLVISPYAKSNYVDSTLASQTSIVSFIEYNWNLGNLGPESYDHMAGSIMNMFDFSHRQPNNGVLYLNPSTGEVVSTAAGPISATQVESNTPGTPNLETTRTCTDVDTNHDVCSTQNSIVNTPIASGSDIWFSATADITLKESSSATTVFYSGQAVNLELKGGNGIPLSIAAPNSQVVFSPFATSVTTTYTTEGWVTTAPVGFQGNLFIGGVAYQVPTGVNLAGDRADWTGDFSGTTVSFTLNWKWAGAVYSSLGTSTIGSAAFYNGLGIKPVDSRTGSSYSNNNPAGTPENFIANFVSSATAGFGPAQYVGVYSAQGSAYYQAYLLNE